MSIFPDNVIDVIAEHLGAIPQVNTVVKRSLNTTDKDGTLAICVDEWLPEEYESGMAFFPEPTMSSYMFSIEYMVRVPNVELGEKTHREVSRKIRLMLYRDEPLRVALRQLVDSAERTERILKWVVAGQQFASNDISGAFVSVSNTSFVVHTETL